METIMKYFSRDFIGVLFVFSFIVIEASGSNYIDGNTNYYHGETQQALNELEIAQNVSDEEVAEQRDFFKNALEQSDRKKISELKVLNTLNSVHDGFVGIMEKGAAYYYTNSRYQSPFRFEVMQVFGNGAILACRNPSLFEVDKCKSMILFIISDTSYADGVALKDGVYICLGSYTYETVEKDKKTVYCLIEREFLRQNWQYLNLKDIF